MRLRAELALLLALVSTVSLAAPAPGKVEDKKAAAKASVTSGPIKITAARAELDQREVALYQGDVKLTSNELTLAGDKLELRQPSRGQFEAKLTGKPAKLTHAATAIAPAMSASASEIHYDTRTAIVDLTGGVSLLRQGDTLVSDSIRYDVAARKISATGAGKGQVQITIQPQNLPSSVPGKNETPKGR